MALFYGRVRFVGSCILGTIVAIPTALLFSSLTVRKEGFLVFLIPLAIVFTAMVEKGWDHARKRDATFIREQSKKRYTPRASPLSVKNNWRNIPITLIDPARDLGLIA